MAAAGPRLTALELLERLVGFDTESQNSNLPLIDFVEDYLRGWGVPVLRAPNREGDKAALFATIGPAERGGVVLSGHTDVVPVAGQAWTSDPFTLRVVGGRAYGRGAVDMKGFCALCLALVPDFLAAGLRTPIHLLFSYDEETTCRGPLDIIRRFGGDLPMPVAAIVGEPTSLEVADAHKSVVTFATTVHGHEAHSAKPALGANAVAAAAELVCELSRIGDEMIARGDPSGRFDPPHATVHVGTVAGGTARNILAKTCRLHWEFRGIPGLDPDEIPRRLEGFAQDVALAAPQPLRRLRPHRNRDGSVRAGPCARSGLRGRTPRPAPRRPQRHRDGALRHRSRPFPGGRRPDGRVRPRLHRPGSPARRIHHPRGSRGRRRLPAPPRGRMRSGLGAFGGSLPLQEGTRMVVSAG